MATEAIVFQQIVDVNWDQAIYTASPNNTINVAQFAAKGSGTNIGIALTPKGTGYISAQVPDGTATGGDARGAGSVDLQTTRVSSGQVASGLRSAIIGGKNNLASAEASLVIGGDTSQATGARASVVGASQSIASGQQSIVLGGEWSAATGQNSATLGAYSEATGTHSAVLGGFASTGSGPFSSVFGGYGANARRHGQVAHSSILFAARGDCQQFWHELSNKTTNDTETELFLNGSSLRLVLTANFVIHARVMIVGSKSDGSAVARYDRQVTIKRVTNTTSLVGSVITLGTDEAAGTSIAITADDTNESLKIAVTGIAAETWRWLAIVQGAELGIGA
jgi:hypothetical protein